MENNFIQKSPRAKLMLCMLAFAGMAPVLQNTILFY